MPLLATLSELSALKKKRVHEVGNEKWGGGVMEELEGEGEVYLIKTLGAYTKFSNNKKLLTLTYTEDKFGL